MKIQLEQRLDLKACPICGSSPLLSIEDMGQPNGRGYPGDFRYYFYCPFCQKVEGNSFTTVYTETKKECIKKAAESWNEEVDKMKTFFIKEEEKWVKKNLLKD